MPSKWITINGTHVPIEKGETKHMTAVKFLKQKGNSLPTIRRTIYPNGNKKVLALYKKLKPYTDNEIFTFVDGRSVPKNEKLRKPFIKLWDKLEAEMKKNKLRQRTSYDYLCKGVVHGMGLDELTPAENVLYPLGLIGASYGLYKAHKGIANRLQKSYPKLHTIPAHTISGGLTGGLLGGTAGAGLAYGLSKMYNKPAAWVISPLMAGMYGAVGAGLGSLHGSLNHHLNQFTKSKKKKSVKSDSKKGG